MKINSKSLKNRIVMPPLVCFNWADDEGYETVDRSKHYGLRNDTGLIVIEACSISKAGRITDTMLGIWEDGHMDQFNRIKQACQDNIVLAQIVHAGYKSTEDKSSSSSYEDCHILTLDEIEKIKEDFINAAVRAYKAGLDGVEIHGAHGYLLNQFTASQINKRNDIYGSDLDGRIKLSLEIVDAVRKATSEDFIIGYRFGVNDPSFKEDLYFVRKLEEHGLDFLNVSIGYSEKIEVPDDFNYHFITYMGKVINDATSIPTACVYGIRTKEHVKYLLKQVDLVAVGKGLLADPFFSRKVFNDEEIIVCHECKRCLFSIDGRKCPANKKQNIAY